jgi:hypothetical protein
MSIELFQPGGVLWNVATDGTQNLNGTQRAYLWFQILAVWMPLGSSLGIVAWATVREYRRSVQTAARQAGRPPR